MTPEAQRIAIAEACGFKWADSSWGTCSYLSHSGHLNAPNLKLCDDAFSLVPDYLNDLNAIAEAEKALPYERLGDYLNRLVECTGYCDIKTFTQANFDLATATASQRAEAFLRTLNLWVEPTTAPKGS
jgi:hypothetical protein